MVDIYIKDASGNIIFTEKVEVTKVSELVLFVKKFTTPATLLQGNQWTEKEINALNSIAELISNHLSQNFSIQELADHAGMNRTKLQAGFKQRYHRTINSFIQDLKMQKAKELLAGTQNFSLKEISGILGYRYTNHFSAAFKKRFNVSPSFYKNTKRSVSF